MDTQRTGLDRFEVALAAVRALGFAGTLALLISIFRPFELGHSYSPVGLPPIFTGASFGAFFLFLALAARREPRAALCRWDRALCAGCGIVAGLALTALIA